MTYPLVKDLAADGFPVAVTCRVLGFSTQAYYTWKAAPLSRRDVDDAYLINAALDIHRRRPRIRAPVYRRRTACSGHHGQVEEK